MLLYVAYAWISTSKLSNKEQFSDHHSFILININMTYEFILIFCDKHDLIECVWQHVYDIVTYKNILLFFTASQDFYKLFSVATMNSNDILNR